MIRDSLVNAYARWFARKRWVKLNRLLYDLSLRGLGVMNYADERVSGEDHFARSFLAARPEAVVLDVGANVGDYAAMIKRIAPARGCGPSSPIRSRSRRSRSAPARPASAPCARA